MGLGNVIVCAVGASAVGITALSVPFVIPALRRVCIPYVPASDTQIRNVLRLLRRCPPPIQPVIDLGSGDGRVVVECAKNGYSAVGVELNLPLVLYSKFNARRNGFNSTKAAFYKRDIFKTDMAPYNVAVLFGAESIVDKIVPKLEEMRDGTHLIMCRFPIQEEYDTSWKLLQSEGDGIDAAWLYRKEDNNSEVETK